MKNKGAMGFGLAFLMVVFIVILCLIVFIDPLKETLDNTRGSSSLNCPGTPNFNQANYDADDAAGKLIKRPVCFVTGLSLVYFVGSVAIAWIIWFYARWTGK